ncbi:MAG: RluA family pseudouridine synthase [Lachnospiraceae bacterium]|nr:RluA family pseudouridine synthase [Lachnospiraceae bacterium]
MREFLIQKNEAGQRFDKYLKKLLWNAPDSFIYKMLRKKNIVLNDKKAGGAEKLQLHDNVKLYLAEETFLKFSASKETAGVPEIDLGELPFGVLYEDEEILVINKPAGMLSQKAKQEDISANEYILSYLLAEGAVTAGELKTFRPSICNRLDRNTSGILIAGKTLAGLQKMAEELKSRDTQKYYRCIVEGTLTAPERIEGYLRKDWGANKVFISTQRESSEDKWIETEYMPIRAFTNATLLEVHLITGRTHQIRAHLASIGHPVAGDVKYGASKRSGIWRPLLHAFRIRLRNGTEIVAPLPEDFLKAAAEFEEE